MWIICVINGQTICLSLFFFSTTWTAKGEKLFVESFCSSFSAVALKISFFFLIRQNKQAYNLKQLNQDFHGHEYKMNIYIYISYAKL